MIIGIDTIGDFVVQSNAPTSLSNKFYLIEAKNAILDEIYVDKNGDITDPAKQDWRIATYLKAMFQGNLEAGNVDLGGSTIDKWKIKRRRIDTTKFKELTIIPVGTDNNFYYLDTTPRSSITYEYEVIPMSGDIEGIPHTVQIQVEFDAWWLSDENEAYPFFINIEVSDITTNTLRHEYLGFNKYPIISYGNSKYKSGTITALLLDSFLETSFNYREKVEAFINNDKSKYLRSPYGDVWYVDTHTSRRKPMLGYLLNGSGDISSITFDWVEVADVSDE